MSRLHKSFCVKHGPKYLSEKIEIFGPKIYIFFRSSAFPPTPGGKLFLVLLMYLVYNTVVQLCQFFLWPES